MPARSAGHDDQDAKDSKDSVWTVGEVAVAVVVALVLLSPLVLIAWSLARVAQPPPTADLIQLVKLETLRNPLALRVSDIAERHDNASL
jgi:hypothetical protein